MHYLSNDWPTDQSTALLGLMSHRVRLFVTTGLGVSWLQYNYSSMGEFPNVQLV